MRLSLDWIKEYVKVTSTPEKLAETLVMTTAEVEDTIEPPLPLQEAVVATITAVHSHPNADRLHLVTVRTGKHSHTVVCGAPNVAVHQKVPYIAIGCHYKDEHGYAALTAATIRGVESAGMLASARDLGFGNDHEGLLILPKTAREGVSVAHVVGWQDPTLDLEITPNRGDLLSYIGLAREVAAIDKTRYSLPPILSVPSGGGRNAIAVTVETALCSRYTATVFGSIQNGPSPLWLQARLLAHDINPQNAVVDITNYVMLELGQPLHAFDADSIQQDGETHITIRTATPDESLVTLDGATRTLTKEDIVIDANGTAVALAGVIGGSESAVSGKTTEIVLESAVFDAVAVRKTATRHSCRTDAVTRFEKGIDPEMTIVAIKRVAKLLHEICGARVIGGITDANYQHSTKQQITVSLERAKRILGVTCSPTEAKSLLTKIGFGVTQTSKHEISVLVPSWRNDIAQEEDIFEELIRLDGYDQIPATLPTGPLCTSVQPTTYRFTKAIRQWFVKNGLRELESQAFMSSDEVATYHTTGKPVAIANPTTRAEAYYRCSLIPRMVERASTESRTQHRLASFEVGDIATHTKSAINEELHAALCLLTDSPRDEIQRVKGICAALPTITGRTGTITFATAKSPWPFFAPNPEDIQYNGKTVGQIGVLSRALTTKSKIRGERYILITELSLDALNAADMATFSYTPAHKYPIVTRDITVPLTASTIVRDAITDVTDHASDIVKEIDVVDYHVTNDGANVTFRITLYGDTTLTDDQVNNAIDALQTSFKRYTR